MRLADFTFEPLDPSPAARAMPAAAPAIPAAVPAEDLLARFAGVVATHGARPAVQDDAGSLTYGQLDILANRIAGLLRQHGVTAEEPVAVMVGRSGLFLAAILGVLKAGGIWLPLDPTLPQEYRRQVLTRAGIRVMLADAARAGDMQRLQWRCPALSVCVCLDADAVDALVEPPGAMMSVELWDHLAGEGADDIGAGGWKSAFTGEPIADAAMAAFGANARRKVEPLLRNGGRVLEVGCASGFTMRQVAPLATAYTACDLSRRNVERVEAAARRLGLPHVFGRQLAAHDIDVLPAASFDLIIFNSVIENFPGFGYLRAVLDKSIGLLRPGGSLFLGSLWDLDRLADYRNALAAFARDHAGEGYATRLEASETLFVPAAFFQDWATGRPERPSLSFSAIDAPGFDPAPYGFDLVVRFDGRGETLPATGPAHLHPARLRLDRRALDTQAPEPPPAASCSTGDTETAADSAACLLFTSGADGQPCGVAMPRSSLSQRIDALTQTVCAPLQTRAPENRLAVACVFSFGFQGALQQSFIALLNGHVLHIPGEETKADPRQLHQFLEQRRITLCDATPSLFSLLVDFWQETGTASTVRTFLLTGEPLSDTLLERFYALPGHRDTVIWNQYGPAEACLVATQHRMTAAGWRESLPPPIGGPLPGVRLQVCDQAGRPLPAGVPGELWIGGAGLARGYFRDPERTGRRFVTDADGQRWLRSGDLVRQLRADLFLWLGREDRQVKIRGCRVEPAEVEAALRAYPLIADAAVVPTAARGKGSRGRDGEADVVLAAYVTPLPGFESARCRAELEATLPAWMVPSWLLPLATLPRTASGALDPEALPPPAALDDAAHQIREHQPFTTDIQRRLATLWQTLLDVPVEAADDDFFLLGGHSVLAVRLVSAVETAFGVRLPLSELFSSSTIARMAARIEAHSQTSDWHPVVAVHTTGRRTPLVCFHPVGGNILCYKELADVLGEDRPVYMIQSYGLEDNQPLHPTVEAMVSSYLEAMKGMTPEGPLALVGWSFGGLLAWEAGCRLQQAGTEVRAVIALDSFAAPDSMRELLRKDEADYLAALFDEMGLGDAEVFRRLTPEQRLDLILDHGKGGHFFPDDMKRQDMRRLLTLFQNNALAAVRYRPPRLEGRLLLIRPRLPSRQTPSIPGDPLSGWGPFPSQGVDLRWMDGTHGHMLTQPYLGQLAQHVRDFLDEVGA